MVPAVILARGGSKRIPRKNIVNFCGKPLIAWSIEQATRAKSTGAVYVSSDDRAILRVASRYGAKPIVRPARLATDHSRSDDALKHALGEIALAGRQPELVVVLQATSPLREPRDIDRAVAEIRKTKADSLFSAGRLKDFYIWRKKSGKFESINYDYKNRQRSQEFGEQFVENGSIYVFRPRILLKYNNRLGGKIAVSLMDFWKSFEIDEREDLKFCEDLFRLKKLNVK